MKVTKANESYRYEAPGHFDVRTTRLHDADDVGGQLTIGLSHFLPGGGSEMAPASKESVYYVIEGEVTISFDGGVKAVLQKGDSVHIAVGENRSIDNTGIASAQMLVVLCPAKEG